MTGAHNRDEELFEAMAEGLKRTVQAQEDRERRRLRHALRLIVAGVRLGLELQRPPSEGGRRMTRALKRLLAGLDRLVRQRPENSRSGRLALDAWRSLRDALDAAVREDDGEPGINRSHPRGACPACGETDAVIGNFGLCDPHGLAWRLIGDDATQVPMTPEEYDLFALYTRVVPQPITRAG